MIHRHPFSHTTLYTPYWKGILVISQTFSSILWLSPILYATVKHFLSFFLFFSSPATNHHRLRCHWPKSHYRPLLFSEITTTSSSPFRSMIMSPLSSLPYLLSHLSSRSVMARGDLRWWSSFESDGCKIWTRGQWGDGGGDGGSWWQKEKRWLKVREIEQEVGRDDGWIRGQGRRWWWADGCRWRMVDGRALCLMRERERERGWWPVRRRKEKQKRNIFHFFFYAFIQYKATCHILVWRSNVCLLPKVVHL